MAWLLISWLFELVAATPTKVLLNLVRARVLDTAQRKDRVIHPKLEDLCLISHINNKLLVLTHQLLDDIVHCIFIAQGADVVIKIRIVDLVLPFQPAAEPRNLQKL